MWDAEVDLYGRDGVATGGGMVVAWEQRFDDGVGSNGLMVQLGAVDLQK